MLTAGAVSHITEAGITRDTGIRKCLTTAAAARTDWCIFSRTSCLRTVMSPAAIRPVRTMLPLRRTRLRNTAFTSVDNTVAFSTRLTAIAEYPAITITLTTNRHIFHRTHLRSVRSYRRTMMRPSLINGNSTGRKKQKRRKRCDQAL